MAKVGAQRAADITGVSKSTIQRAMKSGKLSFSMDSNGYRVIDVSELDRVYGLQTAVTEDGRPVPKAPSVDAAQPNSVGGVEQELAKANTMIEMERMKMKIDMLEQKLEIAEAQIEDLKGQRDQWQKQASQVLITSEYSQKQAEELKEQIRIRDERVRMARERREKQKREQAETAGKSKRIMRKEPQATSVPAESSADNVSSGFVDNTRSYTDLTEDARLAEEIRKQHSGGLMGFVKRITKAA